MTEEILYGKIGGKLIRYTKLVKTLKGDSYAIPFPDYLKECGGLDIHFSDHGDLKHIKSRKLNFCYNLQDLFKGLVEIKKEDLPMNLKMGILKIDRLPSILEIKNSPDGKKYLDFDSFNEIINNLPQYYISKIEKLPRNRIGIFNFKNSLGIFILNKPYFIEFGQLGKEKTLV